MLWNYKYSDRGSLTQGVDYPDDKRAEKLNNHRKPSPPPDLRQNGWRWYCQSPGLGVLHKKPICWDWSLAETQSLLLTLPEAQRGGGETSGLPSLLVCYWANPTGSPWVCRVQPFYSTEQGWAGSSLKGTLSGNWCLAFTCSFKLSWTVHYDSHWLCMALEHLKNWQALDFLVGQWLRLCPSNAIGTDFIPGPELRSHMPHGTANK